MRRIGIIAGTSWASTALYCELINKQIAARLGGLHSATILLDTLDLAPLVKLQLDGEWGAVTRLVADSAQRLERAGAEGLLMTSDGLHKVYDQVTDAVSVPVLHVADAIADRLVADSRTRVGLLGTRVTMAGGPICDRLEEHSIGIVPIDLPAADEVDRIIHQELAAGRVSRDSQRKLKSLITELAKQRAQAIVLGCAELALAVDVRANVLPVYDSISIHALAAADWMLSERPPVRAAA